MAWSYGNFFTAGAINRLRSCYIRCMKSFFEYTRRYSVTSMLLELYLPTFGTLLWNSRVRLINQLQSCNNTMISQLQLLWCDFILFFYDMSLRSCTIFYISCLWFITVFVCVCVSVCFMSMGFMPEINSCYAMLNTFTRCYSLQGAVRITKYSYVCIIVADNP